MCARTMRWPSLLLLLGLACAGDDRVVYSDEEPTEPLPQARTSGPADTPPEVRSSQPSLSYARSLLGDPARARERFDFVQRLALGEERMQPEFVTLLKKLLKDGDKGLRANVVQALGRSGDAGARVALLRSLGDKAAVVRAAAVEALTAIEGSDVTSKLTRMLENRRNALRRAAAAALGRRVGARFPGGRPDGIDPVEHMRYLELTAVTAREDLFRKYVAPGRKGRSAGLLYRVTPIGDEVGEDAPRPQSFRIYAPELTVQRFTDEIAPGLMIDLEGDEPACSGWKRGKAECRCITDNGQRYRVRLRKTGKNVMVSEIEWFPKPTP